jgi:hypothetical protein
MRTNRVLHTPLRAEFLNTELLRRQIARFCLECYQAEHSEIEPTHQQRLERLAHNTLDEIFGIVHDIALFVGRTAAELLAQAGNLQNNIIASELTREIQQIIQNSVCTFGLTSLTL